MFLCFLSAFVPWSLKKAEGRHGDSLKRSFIWLSCHPSPLTRPLLPQPVQKPELSPSLEQDCLLVEQLQQQQQQRLHERALDVRRETLSHRVEWFSVWATLRPIKAHAAEMHAGKWWAVSDLRVAVGGLSPLRCEADKQKTGLRKQNLRVLLFYFRLTDKFTASSFRRRRFYFEALFFNEMLDLSLIDFGKCWHGSIMLWEQMTGSL